MAQTKVQVHITAKDDASKVVSGVGKSFGKLGGVVNKFRNNAKQAGLVLAGLGTSLLLVGKNAVSIASDLEQNRIAFETMTGSAKEAKDLMQKLSDFAVKTPFDMPGVISAGKQLMAMGSSVEDVIPDLKMMGDVAAGLGVPLSRLILNFGQVRMQGKLTGRELRDFAVAGVPLIDQLAESLGVAKNQIAEMVSKGKIGFADVKKAFQDMTSEGGKFNNLMIKQSTTLQGTISNLKDELMRFAAEIVGVSTSGEIREGSLFAVLKQGAEKLLEVVSELRPKVQGFMDALMKNKAAIGALAGAFFGILIAPLIIMIALMGQTLLIVGAVIAIFAVLGAAIMGLKQLWENNFLGIQNIVKATADFFQSAWELIKQIIQGVTDWFMGTALPAIQGFFDEIKKWLLFFAAIWQLEWAVIYDVLALVVKWFWGWAGPTIMKFFGWVKSIVKDYVEDWKKRFALVKQIIQIAVNYFNEHIYPQLVKFFTNIKKAVSDVKEWFSKRWEEIKKIVQDALDYIKGIIDRFKPKIHIGLDLPNIEAAWENLKRRARDVGIPGFQAGGIVPGPIGAPVPALLHAGERVIPAGVSPRGGGDSGGKGVTFEVHIGLYAGSETEKRNIAKDLYAALVQVAQSQNKTVRELMGA